MELTIPVCRPESPVSSESLVVSDSHSMNDIFYDVLKADTIRPSFSPAHINQLFSYFMLISLLFIAIQDHSGIPGDCRPEGIYTPRIAAPPFTMP